MHFATALLYFCDSQSQIPFSPILDVSGTTQHLLWSLPTIIIGLLKVEEVRQRSVGQFMTVLLCFCDSQCQLLVCPIIDGSGDSQHLLWSLLTIVIGLLEVEEVRLRSVVQFTTSLLYFCDSQSQLLVCPILDCSSDTQH